MPNFNSDDGEDTCGCTMGHACSYHAEQHARRRGETAAQMRVEGWGDPDAHVPEALIPFLLELEGDDSLSNDQKRQIRRMLFAREAAPAPDEMTFEEFMRSVGLS